MIRSWILLVDIAAEFERFDEVIKIFRVMKNNIAVIAPGHYMVNSGSALFSGVSGHIITCFKRKGVSI